MAEPKIGIIGAGGIAPSHIEGFLAAGAEVVAIANRTVSKAQSLAGRYAIPLVCSSLDEMLAKAPLDAVAIAAPTFMHAPLAVQALRAGLHVFCEKPPALNAHEAEAMADAAARSGKVLMFNFNNRARPEAQAMMEFIQRGGVGRINSAQAAWVRQMGIPGYGGWFTNKKYAGGGAMIDLIHMADLALYFMDFPKPDYVLASNFYNFQHDEAFRSDYGEQIEAESSSGGGQKAVMDVETACHAMVTFKTGQCLMIRASWAEMVERERASVTFQGAWAGGTLERIFSTQGGPLVADTTDGFGRAAADNGKNSYIDRCKLFVLDNGKIIERSLVFGAGQDDMGRRANVANFVKAMRGEARPLNTPNQAVRLMKIIDAIYESAATKQPVSVAG